MTFEQDELTAMAKAAGARTENWATRLFPAAQFLMTPDELAKFAALVAEKAAAAELEACGKARAGKPRELPVCGFGSLYSEQQFCFEKGFREGAAAVRSAIRARGQKEGA